MLAPSRSGAYDSAHAAVSIFSFYAMASSKRMTFQLAHIENYGTSTPAVARTVLQGRDIIQVLTRTPKQDEQASLALVELMRGLLR